MMNKGSILIIVLLILLIYVSCKNETKFNKIGWNDKTDPVFPSANREIMLNDLIKNYSLKNLSYGQLINLVGKPDYIENGVITYSINVNFGHDIDPVYTKDLVFYFSKDSIINSFKILEWNK